jgi:hypothetical protein
MIGLNQRVVRKRRFILISPPPGVARVALRPCF